MSQLPFFNRLDWVVVLIVIVLIALASAANWAINNKILPGPSLSPFPSPTYEFCIQVITRARNPETGEERDFPTPCDVPEGWQKID